MFKNLPKDLLAAAAGVLDESAKNRQAHYRNVVKSALEQFKVQSFTQLSEIEQRIFSEWVVQRLDEEGHVHTESCGCGEEEDLLHKQAKVNAHSGLPELGEEDEKELDEEDGEEVPEEDGAELTEDASTLLNIIAPLYAGLAVGATLGRLIALSFPKIDAFISNLGRAKRVKAADLADAKAALAKLRRKIETLKTEEGKAQYAKMLKALELRVDAIEPLIGEEDEKELDEADEDNSEKEVKEEDEEDENLSEEEEDEKEVKEARYNPHIRVGDNVEGIQGIEGGHAGKVTAVTRAGGGKVLVTFIDAKGQKRETFNFNVKKLSEEDGEDNSEKEVNEEDEATLDEGGMPSGIIKYKQKLSYMSDEEFAKKFADTSDDRLRAMAWSHGYGKNSPVYVNAKIRGKEALKKDPSTNLKESVGSVSQVVWTSGAEEGKALLQVPKGEYDKNPDSSSLKTLKIKVPAAKALTKLSADRNTVKVAGGAKEGEYYLVKVEFTTRQGLQREDYASPEPSSAIGHRIGVESPKHADVIKDTSLQTGDQFRLMLQFVNSRPEFIPPVSLPGAPSVEALGELVAEYDDDNGVISKALADALDVPSERPAHRGNDLSESKLAGKFPVK